MSESTVKTPRRAVYEKLEPTTGPARSWLPYARLRQAEGSWSKMAHPSRRLTEGRRARRQPNWHPHILLKTSIIRMAPGPMMTMNMAGKMHSSIGNRILIGTF